MEKTVSELPEGFPSPIQVAKQFLEQNNVQEYKLLFAMIAGSHAYNCNLEAKKSDFDFLGVYVAPTKALLGLQELRPNPLITVTSSEKADHDITIYEVGRFCELLQTGNPLILQMLFTSRYFAQSEEFEELRALAPLFITQQTVFAYIGYVKSELKQLAGKTKLDYSKFLYHAFRLVMELERIVQGLPPRIWFEGEDRDFLLGIRKMVDTNSRNVVLRQLQDRLAKIESGKPWSNLKEGSMKPGTKSFEALNEWLLKVRSKC